VGLNTCNAAPTTCVRDLAAAWRAGAGAGVSREALLAAFCNAFEAMAADFEQARPAQSRPTP
jgi:hypothetical protein